MRARSAAMRGDALAAAVCCALAVALAAAPETASGLSGSTDVTVMSQAAPVADEPAADDGGDPGDYGGTPVSEQDGPAADAPVRSTGGSSGTSGGYLAQTGVPAAAAGIGAVGACAGAAWALSRFVDRGWL